MRRIAPKRGRAARKKKNVLRPLKPPVMVAKAYQRELLSLVRSMQEDVYTNMVPLLKQLEPQYINDAYAADLDAEFEKLINRYAALTPLIEETAVRFTNAVDASNAKRFNAAITKTVGVDLRQIVRSEGLTNILQAATHQNVSLISSIPAEHFKNLESMIWSGVTQGSSADSMIKKIQDIGEVSKNRARIIARDQTAKLNSALSQERQQNVGVEEYVWQTSGNDNVRPTHVANNGKTFRWDDPPPETGHPGNDILCNCIALGVLPF